ncbi:helix-turn-helix domain-containing protein [Thalassococcus sp. CAU 1522]|uniref:Helix-turn-helix domain-containing protein n=1 Tax=Thalassococcus arenae TaxID=2851652 RepID=A0ABS6N7Q7_9RHOB|nr:helix-turn-helix transcriptional regulator [Thalassococcus arenae]MBV2360036.1 helix-turn-helix domain-containing protein [Thalassococcus arenae]
MEDIMDWYGPEAATFGDRVAAARDAAGLDQEGLARRLGVKLKTLQAWEDDRAEPRANKLQMMAGLLNVSMVWLLTGEGEGLGEITAAEAAEDLGELLLEIRAMRSQMLNAADRLGKLDKRLRIAMSNGD